MNGAAHFVDDRRTETPQGVEPQPVDLTAGDMAWAFGDRDGVIL